MMIEPTEELISRIKSILIDRDVLNYIFDLRFQTCDDQYVRASKILLAARSPVFRTMFLLKSTKEMQTTLRVAYRAAAVRYLVDFCCAGGADLGPPSAAALVGVGADAEEHTRTLVHLIAMAKRYEIYELHSAAVYRIFGIMAGARGLLCCALDEAARVHEPFAEMILDIIALNPKRALFPSGGRRRRGLGGVLSLGVAALGRLAAEPAMCCTEETLYEVVRYWVDRGEDGPLGDEKLADAPMEELVNDMELLSVRRKDATYICAQSLQFYRIPPQTLAKSALPAGLISIEDLSDAMKKQRHYDQFTENIYSSNRSLTPGVVDCQVIIGAGIDGANGVYRKEAGGYVGRTADFNGTPHQFCIQKLRSFVRHLSPRHLCPCLASRCSGAEREQDVSWLLFATPEGGGSRSRPTKYVLLYETIENGGGVTDDGEMLAPLMDFHCSSHSDFIEFSGKFPSPRQFSYMNSSSRKALKRSSQR